MIRIRKWFSLLAIAIGIVVADQISKALVVANLALYEAWAPVESLRHLFTVTRVHNTGAAFGLFPDGGAFFALVALIVVGIVIYFYRTLPAHEMPLIGIALGLQLGGALGNLIDRLRQGYVVDFLDFKFWPVFNIADGAIVVGTLSLLVLMWWQERRAAQEKQDGPPTPPPPEEKPSSVA